MSDPKETKDLTETAEETAAPAKAKKPKHIFTTKQLIISIVIAVLAAFVVIGTITCAVNHVNPVSYIAGEANKGKLVGKWQSESPPAFRHMNFLRTALIHHIYQPIRLTANTALRAIN